MGIIKGRLTTMKTNIKKDDIIKAAADAVGWRDIAF